MIENFIVIQLTFAEIFVPQYFTIRTTPGLSEPANTCDKHIQLNYKLIFFWVSSKCHLEVLHFNNIYSAPGGV